MYITSFFKFNLSLHFLLISIVFSVLANPTQTTDPKFQACKPRNCGHGPNISYPFWIANQQQSYCGLPDFRVTCKGKNPVLNISSDDFMIKDVFYTNNSFLLANTRASDFKNTCPIPLTNFSLEGTPFIYSDSYADLYFFYHCAEYSKDQTYCVDCASNATSFSFAVFNVEILEHNNYSIGSCQSWVNAPVEAEDIKQLLAMNFTDVLRKGFVLDWSEGNCRGCERSGGRCGADKNEFICFCPDRPHSKTCDDRNGLSIPIKFAIGFGTAGVAILVMGLVFFIYRCLNKKRIAASGWVSKKTCAMVDLEKAGTCCGIQTFNYNELAQATNNFDPKKELGDGGFSTVYKGKLRDGRVVAVKRLYENNYKRVEQFLNEIEILTRLRHQNLVSLYGCTSDHSRELLLVYEYIPNGTLADHLHGERAQPGSLPWTTRMNIAIETASALSYLHASDVIHRDVKTTNLLLDNNFSIKVADFGLSRLLPTDVTHISTAPQGTLGYVDPEYHECYQLTDKSDVYSFGVVLIELVSSKPAVDLTRNKQEINLANMAISKIQNHKLHELVDPWLGFESDYKVRKMITEVAELAFQCLQGGRDVRPSMGEVLEVLKGIQKQNGSMKNAKEVGVVC